MVMRIPKELQNYLNNRSGNSFVNHDPQLLLFATLFLTLNSQKSICIITADEKQARHLADFLDGTLKFLKTPVETNLLPSLSLWGLDSLVNQSAARKLRLTALTATRKQNAITVTTLPALWQKTFSKKEFDSLILHIEKNTEVDFDHLVTKLKVLGYREGATVDESGFFQIKGSIIDLFPVNTEHSFRIQFAADTVESIKIIDSENDRSKMAVNDLLIAPIFEVDAQEKNNGIIAQFLYDLLLSQKVRQADRDGFCQSLLNGYRPHGFDLFLPILRQKFSSNQKTIELFPNDTVFLFADSKSRCDEAAENYLASLKKEFEADMAAEKITLSPDFHFEKTSAENWKEFTVFDFENQSSEDAILISTSEQNENTPKIPEEKLSLAFELWTDWMNESKPKDSRICVLCHQEEEFDRIRQLFSTKNMNVEVDREIFEKTFQSQMQEATRRMKDTYVMSIGHLNDVVYYQPQNIFFIPQHKLLGLKTGRETKRRASSRNSITSFRDLKPGDFVVHLRHGIGRFTGMENLTISGFKSDFLVIEYADQGKIYLPVDKLSMIQKYASEQADSKLDKLGGNNWEKRTLRARKSVLELAEKLVKLQAERALAIGHKYSAIGFDYLKFEEEFSYTETPDQLRAIYDVNVDFNDGKIMDRLICGDVGFGKTEVALRASMRVVLEGQQVVILVPTTILCFQHFRTFSARLGKHSVQVAQINRFVDSKTASKVFEDFAAGQIDILIGTHRILSDRVVAKKLGLMIIDEEQRFGVVHKEKLKSLRAATNILTLTATPIPRTLNLAMMGLKDISIIASPPENRLAVKTYVAKVDENLIRDAITRELSRGGQVFYVYNRVEDMAEMCSWLKTLCPTARIQFAHGQLKDQELEDVIIEFIEQKFDVLLCTTIIESGVDMPNVNTLIVHNADQFGVSQLYQIRGRVGRSTQQGYAYFLIKSEDRITDDARKRLEVLTTYQELGSGFQIATQDLEIRGAGNILGSEQSGHISEVGFELYMDMLNEAVLELRGLKTETKKDFELKLPVTTVIPDQYIASQTQRLRSYRQIFSAQTEDDLIQIKKDIHDRFGEMPAEVHLIFSTAVLRLLLMKSGAVQITQSIDGSFIDVKLGEISDELAQKLIGLSMSDPKKYRVTPDSRLLIYERMQFLTFEAQQKSIEKLMTMMRQLTCI